LTNRDDNIDNNNINRNNFLEEKINSDLDSKREKVIKSNDNNINNKNNQNFTTNVNEKENKNKQCSKAGFSFLDIERMISKMKEHPAKSIPSIF
jgi:hypothetical protein